MDWGREGWPGIHSDSQSPIHFHYRLESAYALRAELEPERAAAGWLRAWRGSRLCRQQGHQADPSLRCQPGLYELTVVRYRRLFRRRQFHLERTANHGAVASLARGLRL